MTDLAVNVLLGAYILAERTVERIVCLLDRQVSAKIIPVMILMTATVLALGTIRGGC